MADTMSDLDRRVNREVLKYAVQRAITCALTGKVLDKRTAVSVTVINASGKRGAMVCDGPAYDGIKDALIAEALKKNATLEILDGRELHRR